MWCRPLQARFLCAFALVLLHVQGAAVAPVSQIALAFVSTGPFSPALAPVSRRHRPRHQGGANAPCSKRQTCARAAAREDSGNLLLGLRAEASPNADSAAPRERACGLGLTILPDPDREGKLVVTAVSPYSFAKQAGCQVGDVLITLDGQDARDITAQALFQKLVGAKDSTIVMLLRTPAGKEKMLTLTRTIPPPRILRRSEDYSNLAPAFMLTGEWEKVLSWSESDLEIAMLKEEPDLKAAAAFAMQGGEAREELGQRESAIQMFQQVWKYMDVAKQIDLQILSVFLKDRDSIWHLRF